MGLIVFPANDDRPLPELGDLDRVMLLPLIQLIICGRSGSMLLHALLDGHPEILHIPHTFKFYDFVAANPNLSEMSGLAIADAFVAHPTHHSLFDSQASVLLRGRLGRNMDDRVVVETSKFREVMAKLLPGPGHEARRILFAAILAHAWCQGQQFSMAKVVFMHLHHGDWLWPNALVETCNLSSNSLGRGGDILSPDKIIVSVRNPADQIRSLERFVPLAVSNVAEHRAWFERYLQILAQDWRRIDLARAAGISLRIVKLEDLRSYMHKELDDLACWMGVTPSVDCMNYPTAFGLPWWGDIYSTPSLSPNPPAPIAAPSAFNADHRFLYSAAGKTIASLRYPAIYAGALIQMAMDLPFFPAPKRSWPTTTLQWKKDIGIRTNFLKQLGQKQEETLVHEFAHSMPSGPTARV
ncbi:MAG: hypothetical protein PHI06_01885 [Desulfobulbaceae bacterium]|nr:hypothetical protein [Desulfobulbaceae bacterium]